MMLRIKCLGLVLLLSLLGVSSEAREWGPLFEEPIRKEVIALQPDSINSDQEGTLNCFYYNGFMVKEVDTRQKGADRLSVTSIDTAKPPPCKDHDPNETVITDWVGYFEGVKGRYVFFAADDGYNGAIAYAVFDSQTRDKLFVLNVEMSTNDQPDKNNIHSLQLSDEALTILYRRAYSGDCSLYDGTSECWQRLQKELTLPADASSPDCRKSYEAAQKRTQAYAAEILKAPTVIGYEARLTYQAGQTVISKETGTISCWISD